MTELAANHLWLRGGDTVARRALIHDEGAAPIECHRLAVGPYGSARGVLAQVIPDAFARYPNVIERHKFCLLYPLPALADLIGSGPMTLAETTPFEERTRYFSDEYVRAISHGIVDFLADLGARRHDAGQQQLELGFDNVDQANPADQDLLAIALRRLRPEFVRLILGSNGDIPTVAGGVLTTALIARSVVRAVPTSPTSLRSVAAGDDLVARFVDADGASDVHAERAAYEQAPTQQLRQLHDRRGALLTEHDPDLSMRLGAVPWHLERGSDPGGAGVRALRFMLDHCVAKGFSSGTVDAGERGRALTGPEHSADDYYHFTAKLATALVPSGGLARSEELYRQLLRTSVKPRVHMAASYAIAMLHTRFYVPRDHDRALELLNQARAFASAELDPVQRASAEVYEDNGLALVHMHRGELAVALALVRAGRARLAREIPADSWLLHRTQLLHNEARLLAVMGRHDDACAAFRQLIEDDPYYVDYRADLGNLLHRLGELDAALAQYNFAVEWQPPFAEIHVNRATIHADRNDLPAAAADYARAVELEPSMVAAWVGLAQTRLDSGDPHGASDAAVAGLTNHPDNADLSCTLASALDAEGRGDEADVVLEAVLRSAPTCVSALAHRAARHYDAGRHERAVADLDAALQVLEDPDLRLNRGLAHEAAGHYHRAISDYSYALDDPRADNSMLEYLRDRCLESVESSARTSVSA